jgi:hypothetical protein
MAQTGASTEESKQRVSSLKHAHGSLKDGTDSEGCLDAPLPAQTYSESGPSGEKPRNSERKQPARASKRDIVFVRTPQLPLRKQITEFEALLSLRPFSRVTARVTKSKVHVHQGDPQLLRLLFESENGKQRERVIRELSKGPPLM